MDNKIKNEDSIFSFKTARGQPCYEFTRDFILPDMYGDLKKILYYTASFDTAGGYPERDAVSDKITYDGTLYIKILFCDESGELGYLTYDLPYSFEARLPECEGSLRYGEKMEIRFLGVKAVNPRKINVRASLCPNLCVFDEIDCKLSDKNTHSTMQTLMGSINSMEICHFIERDISFSEDIIIDRSMPCVDKIAFFDVTPQITDSRCDGNRIYVKGYADAELICKSGDEVFYYTKRIMVEKSIEAKGLDPNASLHVYMKICRSGVSVNEDETGEARIVEADFIGEIGAVCVMNVENTYVCDVYAIGCDSKYTTKEVRFAELERPKSFTQNRRVALNTAAAPVAFFTKTKTAETDGATQITVEIFAIVKNGEGQYVCENISDSFFVDFPSESDPYFGYCDIEISDKSVRAENGSVYLCYNVTGRSISFKNDVITCVDGVEILSEVKKERPHYILYYPEAGESDWDIAKKFKVGLSSVADRNQGRRENEAVLIAKK